MRVHNRANPCLFRNSQTSDRTLSRELTSYPLVSKRLPDLDERCSVRAAKSKSFIVPLVLVKTTMRVTELEDEYWKDIDTVGF